MEAISAHGGFADGRPDALRGALAAGSCPAGCPGGKSGQCARRPRRRAGSGCRRAAPAGSRSDQGEGGRGAAEAAADCPQLLKLPQFSIEVQFDADSPIIRPDSYRTLGRIADALQNPALLAYGFLIVGHTESTGKREINLTLSQRRADSIRDVLVTTFKVSSKRLQAVGLGEEQLRDTARPAAPVNQRIQVISVKTMP